jgi:hypothetical protein
MQGIIDIVITLLSSSNFTALEPITEKMHEKEKLHIKQ